LAKFDTSKLIQQKIREKYTEKKLIKILHLKNKKRDKQYKKILLLRRFDEEDELEATTGLSKVQKEIRA
jgi:hypothetical protein